MRKLDRMSLEPNFVSLSLIHFRSRSPLSLWISFSWICMCAVLTFIEQQPAFHNKSVCSVSIFSLSLTFVSFASRTLELLSLFLSDIAIATATYYRDNSRLIIFESGKKLFARVSATTTATPCATTDQSEPSKRIRPDCRQHVGWNVRMAYVDEVITRERLLSNEWQRGTLNTWTEEAPFSLSLSLFF